MRVCLCAHMFIRVCVFISVCAQLIVRVCVSFCVNVHDRVFALRHEVANKLFSRLSENLNKQFLNHNSFT